MLAREYNPLSQHDQEPLAKDCFLECPQSRNPQIFSNESYDPLESTDPVGTEESVPDKFSAPNPILSKSQANSFTPSALFAGLLSLDKLASTLSPTPAVTVTTAFEYM